MIGGGGGGGGNNYAFKIIPTKVQSVIKLFF